MHSRAKTTSMASPLARNWKHGYLRIGVLEPTSPRVRLRRSTPYSRRSRRIGFLSPPPPSPREPFLIVICNANVSCKVPFPQVPSAGRSRRSVLPDAGWLVRADSSYANHPCCPWYVGTMPNPVIRRIRTQPCMILVYDVYLSNWQRGTTRPSPSPSPLHTSTVPNYSTVPVCGRSVCAIPPPSTPREIRPMDLGSSPILK